MTTAALAVLLAVWTAAVWFLNRPGHLTIDSLVQIAEGRSGVFESYNPLFISVVFGRLTALTGDTGPLVFVAAAAFALAAWLLLSRIARPRLTGLLGCAVLLFLPILLIYPGIVWKDVWFAHSALLGFALVAVRAGRRGGPIGWGIEALCLALFAFAMLSRQTGVLVSLVGVVLLAIAARPAGVPWRLSRLALGIVARLLVLFALAQVLTLAAQSGARQITGAPFGTGVRQVAIFDIAGMLQRLPQARLERLSALGVDTATFEQSGRRLFSAERVDTLDMPPIRGLWDVPLTQVLGQWLDLAAAHPVTYLAHRAEVYAWLLGLRDQARCLPVHVGRDDGPLLTRAGVDPAQPPQAGELYRYATRFVGSPYFSPLAWALVSVVVLIRLGRQGRLLEPVAGLQWAGLLYLASYAPIGLSCDFRYTYFSVAAASLGLMHWMLQPGRRTPVTGS